ncbi:DUF4892 domain-containing protein [Gallaecimonas sp. GXIMD4217]|uniref:OmpA family protein n=1 Tax=Gallaecimonas sp. GXIMD4217 TaxID=3131927 RepID=UPI00311ABE2D
MKIRTLALALLTGLLSAPTFAATDASGLFTLLPGSKKSETLQRHYSPYQLVTGRKGRQYATTEVAGKLTSSYYKLSGQYAPSHIFNNYRQALQEQGAELLFQCREQDCGNERKFKDRIGGLFVYTNEMHYLAARLPRPQGDIYAMVVATTSGKQSFLQLDVVETIPEPLGLVKVNGDFLGQAPSQISFKDNRQRDKQGSADHPLLARLPGAHINDYRQLGFAKVPFARAVTRGKATLEQGEGKLTQIGYELPRGYSEYEVHANYQAALEKLGFVEQFSCRGKACGSEKRFAKAIDSLEDIGFEENQYYGWYKLARPEGDVHVSTYVLGFPGRLGLDLKVLESSALKDDRVAINLEGLNDAMASQGRAILDGLLFKYDSDQLLPESKPVLDVLVSYLKANPRMRFYVVGHTDDKGKRGYNQALAKRRADAVVKTLQGQGLAPAQLEAVGVGEFAPVASNLDEQGQAQNRRVELVVRSDQS